MSASYDMMRYYECVCVGGGGGGGGGVFFIAHLFNPLKLHMKNVKCTI